MRTQLPVTTSGMIFLGCVAGLLLAMAIFVIYFVR
jgi:hypothetical protein